MAAEERHRQLTEEDISEFGRQLYEWSKNLPIAQRGLLHRLLSRAAAAGDGDTLGFMVADLQSLELSTITDLLATALLPESKAHQS